MRVGNERAWLMRQHQEMVRGHGSQPAVTILRYRGAGVVSNIWLHQEVGTIVVLFVFKWLIYCLFPFDSPVMPDRNPNKKHTRVCYCCCCWGRGGGGWWAEQNTTLSLKASFMGFYFIVVITLWRLWCSCNTPFLQNCASQACKDPAGLCCVKKGLYFRVI